MNFTKNFTNSSESDNYDYEYVDDLTYCLELKSQVSCSIYCWIEGFFVLFSGFTLPVYLIFMYILIRYHKELNSSFFSICISAGVSDILYTLFKYGFQILPKLFWYEEALLNYYMATMGKIGHWGIYFCQVFGVVLMTANRFSAIVFPMSYKMIWSRKKLWIGILLQWVLPFPLVAPMFVGMIALYSDIPDDSWWWVKFNGFLSYYNCFYSTQLWDEEVLGKIYFNFSAFFEPWLVIAILVMHVVMVVKQVQYSKKIAPTSRQNANAKHQRELRLAASGFIITILYSAMVLVLELQNFGIYSDLVVSSYYWFSDLFTCCNPFLLVLFSSKIRKYFMKIIYFWREDQHPQQSYVSDLSGASALHVSAAQRRAQSPSRVSVGLGPDKRESHAQ